MNTETYKIMSNETLASMYADWIVAVTELDNQREADDEPTFEHQIPREILITEIERLAEYHKQNEWAEIISDS